MNERLSRTLALLAVLSVAGPAAAYGADVGPQLSAATNPSTTIAKTPADKAAEAQLLAAMAAQLAQQAAQLAAESQLTAPAPAAIAATAPATTIAAKAGWSPTNAASVEITDTASTSATNGWRTHKKAGEIAIRFKGQAVPIESTPAASAAPIAAAAPASQSIAPPSTAASAAPSIAQGANELEAAKAGKLTESHVLNDANVQLAARNVQDDSLIPDAEPVPPVPPYGDGNGNHRRITEEDVSEPLPVGNGSDYCGGDACCDTCCCPPQRMLFWTAGVEATFLNPDMNNSIAEFGVINFNTETENYTDTDDVDVDSFYLSPRVWLGVQGCKWGANLRYFHLNANEAGYDPVLGSNGEWDGPDCGVPDFGYSSSNQLEAYTVDLEVTRRVCMHDCNMLFSMGVRHAEITQDEMVAGAGLTDDSQVFGFASAHRESRGTGLVFGWYGRRPIFPCSCVHWFYNARFSSVWGPTQTGAQTGTALSVETTDPDAIGVAGSVNNASTYVDDTMFIGEIQLGLEWDYALQCLPANAFFRTAVEYQRWDGGKGYSAAGSFAGVEIDDEPTTFAETFASATEPQLDLIGITIGTGLTW